MAFGYSLASYARRPASRLASCLTVVAAITPLATHRATSSHFIRLTIPSFRENQNFGRNDGYRHAISQINVSREGHQISLLQAAYYFIVRGISYAYVNLPLLQRRFSHAQLVLSDHKHVPPSALRLHRASRHRQNPDTFPRFSAPLPLDFPHHFPLLLIPPP